MNSMLKYDTKKYQSNTKVVPVIYPILMVVSVFTIFFALVNNLVLNHLVPMDNYIAVLIIVISVYTCYMCRYIIGFFIASLVIAYANYSIAVGVYLDTSIRPAVLYNQFSEESLSVAILCVLIFETGVLWMLKYIVKNRKSVDRTNWSYVKNERNDIIAYGAMVLYVLIVFFTFDFGKDGSRGTIDAITEYRLIILIIGSYYSCRKPNMKVLWTIIVGVTSMFILLSGNRVDSIGNMIALIILWYPKFVTFKKILLVLPATIIAITAIGVVRGGTLSLDIISAVISNLTDTKLVWDTAIFAYVPSVSIVQITGDVDIVEKLRLLGEFINYTFVGTTDIQSQNLIYYSLQWHLHYGGCITPTYFYMWFGYIGAVVFSALVYVYCKLYFRLPMLTENTFKSNCNYIISVYFVSSVCRWYCYGPNSLIRSIFVAILLFAIVYGMNKILKRAK